MITMDLTANSDSQTRKAIDTNTLLDRLFDERQSWLDQARQAEQSGDRETASRARQHMSRIAMEAAFLINGQTSAATPVPQREQTNLILFPHSQQKGN